MKNIASIVGQIISMSASCGNVTQTMTRYLHLITNSRSSWNSFVWVHDQAKQELHFWRDKLRSLNGILFWPIFFVPSKVLFTDRCFVDRLWRFYLRFFFCWSQKLVRGRISEVFYLERTYCNRLCCCSL